MEEIKTEEKKQSHKKVDRAFLRKEVGFKKTIEEVPDLKEYVLLLMKNNGHTDFIEGVQAGEFYMKTADGKQEKSILLTPQKLTTINYNKQYWKGWIAHEDNMIPYPQDPLHSGEMYRKTTQKLAMNYRDANEAKFMEAKTKMIMYIILGSMLVIYVLYIIAKKAGWLTGEDPVATTQAVIQTVETVRNNTGVTVG